MKKLIAMIMTCIIALGICLPVFAAEPLPETPVNVNATLYKTGTSENSMGNPAFAQGGILEYSYNTNGDIQTTVTLDVEAVHVMGFIPGYMTSLNIAGSDLEGIDFDGDGNIDQFYGVIPQKIELNTRYVATVNINVIGEMGANTQADIVFTNKAVQ